MATKSKVVHPVIERPVFNLLDEPWLKVLKVQEQGSLEEVSVSLCELFEQAHTIKKLSGEVVVQDVAVLRLLLAILHCVYTRTSEYIQAREDGDKDAALELWNSLYNAGRFDAEKINSYLRSYQDRFYLIHPQRPFYQVADLLSDRDKITNTCSIRRLIGDISESASKPNLFSYRNCETEITYAEAARWLLHLNAYDDTSNKPLKDTNKNKNKSADSADISKEADVIEDSKNLADVMEDSKNLVEGVEEPKKKEAPPKKAASGTGWVGSLGLVYIEGKNLFETLMLNFVLYNVDATNPFWEDGKAPWELDEVRKGERVQLAGLPKSQIELLTLQSRRIWLLTSDTGITGYRLIAGDFFGDCDAVNEQMTLLTEKKKAGLPYYTPKKHNSSMKFWTGFASVLAKRGTFYLPGVLRWFEELRYLQVDTSKVTLCAASLDYISKNSAVQDVWEDSFTLSAALLSKSEETGKWLEKITKSLSIIENLSSLLAKFTLDIRIVAGLHVKPQNDATALKIRAVSKENYYAKLDTFFRHWLLEIDTAQDCDTKCEELLLFALNIALSEGQDIYSKASNRAYRGIVKENSRGNNAFLAYKSFKKNAYAKVKGEMKK